jgi:hypothetical protein
VVGYFLGGVWLDQRALILLLALAGAATAQTGVYPPASGGGGGGASVPSAGMVKSDGSALQTAVAGTDFQIPLIGATCSAGQHYSSLSGATLTCSFDTNTWAWVNLFPQGSMRSSPSAGDLWNYNNQIYFQKASGTDTLALGSSVGAYAAITPTATAITSGPVQEYELHLQVSYSALILASTVQDVALFTAPQGFKLRGLTLIETTPFSCSSCSGITSITAAVGRGATSPSDYQLPTPLMQAAGNMRDTGGHYSPVWASHTVYVEFNNTTSASPANFGNGTASTLTAGLLDIYIWYVTAF